jgi:hypothetical protein
MVSTKGARIANVILKYKAEGFTLSDVIMKPVVQTVWY